MQFFEFLPIRKSIDRRNIQLTEEEFLITCLSNFSKLNYEYRKLLDANSPIRNTDQQKRATDQINIWNFLDFYWYFFANVYKRKFWQHCKEVMIDLAVMHGIC